MTEAQAELRKEFRQRFLDGLQQANGVALRNERLIAIEDEHVLFWYKDYRDHSREKLARVPAVEFIDRFLLHVLPRHLRHIRRVPLALPVQHCPRLSIQSATGSASAALPKTVATVTPVCHGRVWLWMVPHWRSQWHSALGTRNDPRM